MRLERDRAPGAALAKAGFSALAVYCYLNLWIGFNDG